MMSINRYLYHSIMTVLIAVMLISSVEAQEYEPTSTRPDQITRGVKINIPFLGITDSSAVADLVYIVNGDSVTHDLEAIQVTIRDTLSVMRGLVSALLTELQSKADADETQLVNGSLTVLQALHDNLNANANLQIGESDVDNGNPVPVVQQTYTTIQTITGNMENSYQQVTANTCKKVSFINYSDSDAFVCVNDETPTDDEAELIPPGSFRTWYLSNTDLLRVKGGGMYKITYSN